MTTWRLLAASAALAVMSWQAQAQTTRGSEAAAATTQAGSTQLATTTDQPDAKIMSSYLKATWTKHRAGSGKLTGSAAVGEIPPTDCPPQPVQVCQDSWKIKTINPFE